MIQIYYARGQECPKITQAVKSDRKMEVKDIFFVRSFIELSICLLFIHRYVVAQVYILG